jgi:hypothetical protein
MKDKELDHAPPDVLVDIAERAAVEARWKEHVDDCEACSKKAEDLEKALTFAGKMDVPEPGDEYWRRFNSRLTERIQKEGRIVRRVNRWSWAAAAIVAVGLWASWGAFAPMSPPPVIGETVLPPADEDAEYQLLLSIAELVNGEENWEERLNFGLVPDLDPTQLTPEEREQLRQELKDDLEGEDDAVS